jgi:hypoxanthine phosphoribosyltransferase
MPRTLTPLITEAEIAARMPSLAAEIIASLPERARDQGVVVVGPLKGCVVFMADLSRALWRRDLSHTFDFLRLASYGAGTESSGVVRLEGDLIHPVEGRHVLLVDDICDTGRTLEFATAHLLARGAVAVTTSVLMDKPSRRAVPLAVDHVGFTIPNAFVVGYGCDLAESYRGMPHIGVLGPE